MVPVDKRPAPLAAIDVVVDQPLSHEDPRQTLEQKEVALCPARLGADVKREVELGLVTELRYHVVAKCAGEWGAVPQSSFHLRAQAAPLQYEDSPCIALYIK